MAKDLKPLKIYQHLVTKGLQADNLNAFVEGLKNYLQNQKSIIYTPCPIVYHQRGKKRFFILPFLDLRLPKEKVWGIYVNNTLYNVFAQPYTFKYGIQTQLDTFVKKTFTAADSNLPQKRKSPTPPKRQLRLPTEAEFKRIAIHPKASRYMETANIMSKHGFDIVPVRYGKYWLFNREDASKPMLLQWSSIHDRCRSYQKYSATNAAYMIFVTPYDEKKDLIGQIDQYGNPDEISLKIIKELKKNS